MSNRNNSSSNNNNKKRKLTDLTSATKTNLLSNVEFYLRKVEAAREFWCFYDLMLEDESKFKFNRSSILDAFKNGYMYTISMIETDEIFKNRDKYKRHKYFKYCMPHYHPDGYTYSIPTFCVVNERDEKKIEIIWTYSKVRRQGFARKLIQLGKFKRANNPLPESLPFWEKLKGDVELIKRSSIIKKKL